MNNPNLDKIAIAVAAVIVFGLIGVTVFRADPVADAVNQIQTHNATIEAKGGPNQTLPSAMAPVVLDDIRPRFTGLDEGARFPDWAFARRPGQARLTQAVIIEASAHEGPKLTKIGQVRDASLRKPVHSIDGVRSSVTNGEIIRIAIERREAGTDEWTSVSEVPPGDGEFSVQIDDVEAGKTYEYRLVSVAKSSSKAGFADPTKIEDTQLSGEYAAEVPHDEAWEFSSPSGTDFTKATPGACWITRRLYDYEKGELGSPDRGRFEAAMKSDDVKNLPKIFDTEWRLRRVEQKEHPKRKKSEFMIELVQIEDRGGKVVTTARMTLWQKDPEKKLECDDTTGDSVEVKEEGAGETAEPPTAEDEAKPKPKPKPTDGDDDF